AAEVSALVGVALLAPRVTARVVAALLPEAPVRVLGQQVVPPAQPLRALPRVQVRDHQPQRGAALGRERLAVHVGGQQRGGGEQVRQRHVAAYPNSANTSAVVTPGAGGASAATSTARTP